MASSFTTRRALARAPSVPHVGAQRAPGYLRRCERRWRSASFFLVERRKGKLWMYGSIALAAALWAYVYLFIQFS
jgi:hypothetical protein